MQIKSNGEYRSIEHRAVVDFHKERLPITAFHGTNFTAKVGPVADLVKEIGEQYKTTDTESLLRLCKHNGKSSWDHMRINK